MPRRGLGWRGATEPRLTSARWPLSISARCTQLSKVVGVQPIFGAIDPTIGFAASTDCAPSAVAKVAKSTDSETVKNDLGFKGWFTNFSIDVVTNALGLTNGCRCPQNSRLSAIDPNA